MIESPHRKNVESYLGLLRTLATDTQEQEARLLVGRLMRKERYRRQAWAIARQAHIVDSSASAWATIDHTADVFLAESVAGGTWKPLDPKLAELSPALSVAHGLMEQEHIYRMAHDAAEGLAVPAPRPFPVLY